MATQSEIRQQVTDKIVAALRAGTAPWRRPWSDLDNTGNPANAVSKRSYTGVNTLLLQLIALERGWSSRWWGTFRQWSELGFRIEARPSTVRPGEWGTKIVFCKPVTKKPAHDQDGGARDGTAVERDSRYLLLRQFCVFNAGQVEGDGIDKYLATPRTATAFENHTTAEQVIAGTNARIEYGGGKAVYLPVEAFIRLPTRDAFEGQREFYATAFHELAHWTGHPSRLDRLGKNARFGDAAYAFEELVAEVGGCFLCTEVGTPQSDDLSNQAAYLASWLSILRADPSAIFSAASQASAATDFILSCTRKEKGGVSEETEEALAGVNE